MRRVSVYDGHASIEIPVDWNEMPVDLLDYLAIRAAETSGGRTTEYYQHGFRPAATDTGFDLPQVLVQIREDGRRRLSDLLNLPTPDRVEAESDGLINEVRGPFLQQLDLVGVSFDPARKVLRVDSTMELLVEGTTAVRSASFLTERGVLVVHCYDSAAAMAASAALFDRIISSVEFDDTTAYRVRWSDRWTRRHSLVVVFIIVVSIVLIATAIRRNRRDRRLGSGRDQSPPAAP